MPLYEYECQQCHRRVEKIQKFSDAPLTVCPHCGGTLERTLTAPAIQFKGSGWYKDLYSSAKPPTSTETGEKAGAGGGDKADHSGSSDSKASGTTAAATPSPSPTTAAPPSSGGGSSTASTGS